MPARRLLFFVILILWATNGALWAWVKASAPPEKPSDVRMLVHTEKAEVAQKIKKAFDKEGLSIEVRANQPWKHEVVEGYLVYITQSNKDLAGPIAQGMRNKGLPVKVVGDQIRLGGVYKNKADANKAKARATKNDFTGFEVHENRVEKTSKKAYLLEIGPVSAEDHLKAEGVLEKFHLDPEQIESETVEAGASASATPS